MTSFWDRVKGCLPCRKPARGANRTVYVGNKLPSDVQIRFPENCPENKIVSSRYTVWNFLPKNLLEQFRRVANLYFLIVGIVQLLIDTPVSPITSILPLAFVVSVTAIKQVRDGFGHSDAYTLDQQFSTGGTHTTSVLMLPETLCQLMGPWYANAHSPHNMVLAVPMGYEDWLRHKSDQEVNNRQVLVMRDSKLTSVKSMQIKVGDIVRVDANKGFPCDLIMVSSADPAGNCYVTTANLDGETNLKETKHLLHEHEFQSLTAFIECQQPIPDLYTYVGNMTIIKDIGEHIVRPLGPENLLLRGARLKNTAFIYGCAIYTGQETKMALNSKAKSTKFSRVEKRMNTFLLIFLLILLAEAIFSTGMKYWYVFRPNVGQPWYVPKIQTDTQVTGMHVLEDFLSFIVLYNYVIPISLYVTIELQKFLGSMFFNFDLDMYDPDTDEPAMANTSDLNEELGQVEYLFTDKTGTLTENDMQFRMCSVMGKRYEEIGGMLCQYSSNDNCPVPVPILDEDLENFLTVLVLCHNVRVDHREARVLAASTMYSYDGFEYEYQASSPDEKAFVEACRRYGVVFHGTHSNQLEVTFKGEMRRYKLLHSLEFDATRKRMSVIVQNENDKIYLLCKGAESSVIDRCNQGDIEATLSHVNEYAMVGLRTLVIAIRPLLPEDYEKYNTLLNNARKSLQDRAKQLSTAFDLVECDLTLVGVTAVEDKLQEDVPKTIQALHLAGIKVWVLTGDKEETAVNISHSAGHFSRDMIELKITQQTFDTECARLIRQYQTMIETDEVSGHCYALVIDGVSLAHCLQKYGAILCQLCMKCSAVLCCRMTPLQKAEVVKLMKDSPGRPVTAAIGDGANDVSMIEEADVGIGIMGKEGRQAVRNSDYAIAKFRFLMKALFVHGHFYYIRIANLVQYFFYKNVAFITAQVFYVFFSAYSEQSLFESYYLMMFNMVFTALPILMYGIFEQHIRPEILLENPRLYKKISKNENLSIANFLLWNGLGLWHCAVMFFGTMFLMGEETSLFSDGKMIGNWAFGTIVYLGVFVIVCLKLSLTLYYWSLPIFVGFAFAAATYFGGTAVYNSVIWPPLLVTHYSLLYEWNTVLKSVSVWLAELVLVSLAILPDVLLQIYRDISTAKDIGRHLQIQQDSSRIPLRNLSEGDMNKFIVPDATPKTSLLDIYRHTEKNVIFTSRKARNRKNNVV